MAAISFTSSVLNVANNGSDNNLPSFLANFISKRIYTVGWEHPHPASPAYQNNDRYTPQKKLFFQKLQTDFSRQSIYEELRKIILDENYAKQLFHYLKDKPLIPCYAAYVLKELGELNTIVSPLDIQQIVISVLQGLEGSYGIYSPSKDTDLNYHYQGIRREAREALVAIAGVASSHYLDSLVSFLIELYKKIAQGGRLKDQPHKRFMGEVWEMQGTISSILINIIEKVSQKDKNAIADIFIGILQSPSDIEELLREEDLEKLSLAVPLKTPSILILLIKAIEKEEQDILGERLFTSNLRSNFENIKKMVMQEKNSTIIDTLKIIERNDNNLDRSYATKVLEKIQA